jgi:gamma-glutamylcyclotransferase (GGCT)/AIG2-like uncharacterized protein YtfP
MDTTTVTSFLAQLNAVRGAAQGEFDPVDSERLEQHAETRFAASRNLAVYGSLAPGKSNHERIAHLKGTWSDGYVEGKLVKAGWGSARGFPALHWKPGAGRVPVWVLESAELPEAWAALDEFEGSDYTRILVPVMRVGRPVLVANIYALRHAESR